jgi:hypothetical protein
MKQIQTAYPTPKCHIVFNNKAYLNCTENLKAFKFSSNYAANFIKVSQMKQIQTLDEVEFSIFSSNYTNIKHFSTVEYIQTAHKSSKYSNSAQIMIIPYKFHTLSRSKTLDIVQTFHIQL